MPRYPYSNTLPIGELSRRNTESRREAAVRTRRLQEGNEPPEHDETQQQSGS